MTFDLPSMMRRVPTTAYVVTAAVTVLLSAVTANNYHQREIGRRDLLIAQSERTNADLRHVADSLAKVYRVDTLRLTKIRRVTDSLTATVEVWKTDTLKVVEYVAKADTAIKSCVQALRTCEQRASVAERGWDGARAEIALLKANAPSAMRPWLYGLAGLGAGVLAGRLVR